MASTIRIDDGDIFIDQNTGQTEMLSGPQKTAQDLANALLTVLAPRTPNRSSRELTRQYGSEVADLAAAPKVSGRLGNALIAKKIAECINRLAQQQRQDPRTTPDEQIARITTLRVEPISPTDFIYAVEVELQSGSKVARKVLVETKLDHQVLRRSLLDDRYAK